MVTLKVFWVRIAATCYQIDYDVTGLLPVVYSEGAFTPASCSFNGTDVVSVRFQTNSGLVRM